MSNRGNVAVGHVEGQFSPSWPDSAHPDVRPLRPHRIGIPFGLTATTSLLALLALLFICFFGFLHEDAYILYIYSRNLVDIGQISFDAVHGPAEGATDFLWMILIAAGYRLGLDPGVSAAILNTIGAGLLVSALASVCALRPSRATHVLLGTLVLVSPMTGAALGGFSTLFYVGLYATVLARLLQDRPVAAIWWTLALCLTRPDGVVLSLGTMSLLLIEQRRNTRVLMHLAAVTVLGGVYFAWRYQYFGELLPLPLIVKSKGTGTFEGLTDNLIALWPMLPALVLTWRFAPRQQRTALLKVLLPAALLFAALSLAHQSQNISFRFQAPIFVSILMALLLCKLPSWKLYAVGLLPFMLLGAKNFALEFRYLLKTDYINVFPSVLKNELGGSANMNIAVTEAGRFPYYFPSVYQDIVGLNSRLIAHDGLDIDKLTQFSPSIIFLHHAQTYRTSDLPPGQRFVRLDRARFLSLVYQPNASTNPVDIAPSVVGQFAIAQTRFDTVYMVRYGRDYFHVYLIDSAQVSPVLFERALEGSFSNANSSHCSQSPNWPCTWAH